MNDTTPQAQGVYIWDRFVRIFHWALVVTFAVAFMTGEGPEGLHLVAGFTLAALIVARLVWGFVGPAHARFTDFAYAPSSILRYLRDLVLMRSERYLGHSPAGGAMIFLLLASLMVTALTGVLVLGAEEGWLQAGPAIEQPAAVAVKHDDENGAKGGESAAVESLEELHEGFANFTLVLVTLHLAGVLLASFAHRENLPLAMITGFKRL